MFRNTSNCSGTCINRASDTEVVQQTDHWKLIKKSVSGALLIQVRNIIGPSSTNLNPLKTINKICTLFMNLHGFALLMLWIRFVYILVLSYISTESLQIKKSKGIITKFIKLLYWQHRSNLFQNTVFLPRKLHCFDKLNSADNRKLSLVRSIHDS